MARQPKTLEFWCDRLPHWEVEGGRYFITLHLAGAIPAVGRERLLATADKLRQTAQRDSPSWLRLQRAVFVEMEKWLDRCEWNPHFKRSEIAEQVSEAIDHRERRGDWVVHRYVIMPSHLHVFCEFGAAGMKKVMEDFKRWTGHQALPLLNGDGLKFERFWQREWFDHWSRSDGEDDRIMAYIDNNPVKAGLVTDYSLWPWRK